MHTRKIEFDWWEAVVEIDGKPETIEIMKEQLLFWVGGQRRIDKANGDVEFAYLEMLGEFLITESMGWSLEGILCQAEAREGWHSLCGKYGIKLISVDSWEFEADSFMITNA